MKFSVSSPNGKPILDLLPLFRVSNLEFCINIKYTSNRYSPVIEGSRVIRMEKIPIISADDSLNKRILLELTHVGITPVFIDTATKAIEYLNYELPDIAVINLSDPELEIDTIIGEIRVDPWLHYGGIIGIYEGREREAAERVRDTNLIALIPRTDLRMVFHRVLSVILANRQIVFQRDLQAALLTQIVSSFVIENDPYDVRTYSNLVTNYLFNTGRIDREMRGHLFAALFELLMNAIEHGNCRISFEEKSAWLASGRDIISLIREKRKNPAVRGKNVYLSYRITPEYSRFTIRDEGEGFDWRSRIQTDPDSINPGLNGRGIFMTRHFVRNLTYNDSGTEVSFEITHRRDEANVVPGIFADQKEVVFFDRDVVFTEGEESDFLYYIVSGKFLVYSKGRFISHLTPDDMFLGEMSFLLGNKRSATVVSDGKSTALKVSKHAFIHAVKNNPHYGIFLSRLLAQRLTNLNEVVVELKSRESAR
jgi:CRP-like cAMP-binding protein